MHVPRLPGQEARGDRELKSEGGASKENCWTVAGLEA